MAAGASCSAGRSAAWKAERRSTEWRLRWLDARTRELRHQAALCSARLSALGAAGAPPGGPTSTMAQACAGPTSAGAAAGGDAACAGPVPMEVEAADALASGTAGEAPRPLAPGPGGPSAGALPAGSGAVRADSVDAKQPVAVGPAAAEVATSRDSERGRPRRSRALAAEVAAPALQGHPFFAAMAGLRVVQQVHAPMEREYWLLVCCIVFG